MDTVVVGDERRRFLKLVLKTLGVFLMVHRIRTNQKKLGKQRKYFLRQENIYIVLKRRVLSDKIWLRGHYKDKEAASLR